MGDFSTKLLLAFIAFLLGLLADVIKRVFQRERKRVEYKIEKRPIVAATGPLPEAVLQKLPSATTYNVTEFTITLENVGSVAISEANALVSLGEGAELLHYKVATVPAREVSIGVVELPSKEEFRLKGFTLEKRHRAIISMFVRSSADIEPVIFGSGGGGDVKWVEESRSARLGFEGHVFTGIKLLVLAQAVEAIMQGFFLLVAALAPADLDRWASPMFPVTSTTVKLVKLYIYLKIVPHALAVVRELTDRFQQLPTGKAPNTAAPADG